MEVGGANNLISAPISPSASRPRGGSEFRLPRHMACMAFVWASCGFGPQTDANVGPDVEQRRVEFDTYVLRHGAEATDSH